jgi:hypothetical protein
VWATVIVFVDDEAMAEVLSELGTGCGSHGWGCFADGEQDDACRRKLFVTNPDMMTVAPYECVYSWRG